MQTHEPVTIIFQGKINVFIVMWPKFVKKMGSVYQCFHRKIFSNIGFIVFKRDILREVQQINYPNQAVNIWYSWRISPQTQIMLSFVPFCKAGFFE